MRDIRTSYRIANGQTRDLHIVLILGPDFKETCDVCVAGKRYAEEAFRLMPEICIFSTDAPQTKKITKIPVVHVPSYTAIDVVTAYASRFKDVLEQAHIEGLKLLLKTGSGAAYSRAIDVAGL